MTRPIRDAFARIPERGFAPGTDFGTLEERLAEVDTAMAERQFGTARDELTATLEAEVPGTIEPEFEPLANQPDEARLTALFEEMIGRLDGLASGET